MANSKNKGITFERSFCKALSLWWTNNDRDDCFWRTDNSGGRATARASKGKQTKSQYGDVAPRDDDASLFTEYFCVELKNGYVTSTIQDILDGITKPDYWEWIIKAEIGRIQSNSDTWLVVHHRPRRETVVLVPYWPFRDVSEHLYRDRPHFRIKVKYDQVSDDIVMLSLENFFRFVSPSTVRTIAHENRTAQLSEAQKADYSAVRDHHVSGTNWTGKKLGSEGAAMDADQSSSG